VDVRSNGAGIGAREKINLGEKNKIGEAFGQEAKPFDRLVERAEVKFR
jgi:hypothetical protein